MEQTRPLFVHFSSFSHDKYSTNLTINDKSVDGMLGTRTRGGRMVGADESTEISGTLFTFLFVSPVIDPQHIEMV